MDFMSRLELRNLLPGGRLYRAKQILEILSAGEPMPGPQIEDRMGIPNSERGELLHLVGCLVRVDFVNLTHTDGTVFAQITDSGRNYLEWRGHLEQPD